MVVEQKQKQFWNLWTKWNNLKPCRSWSNEIFWIRITLLHRHSVWESTRVHCRTALHRRTVMIIQPLPPHDKDRTEPGNLLAQPLPSTAHLYIFLYDNNIEWAAQCISNTKCKVEHAQSTNVSSGEAEWRPSFWSSNRVSIDVVCMIHIGNVSERTA